MPAVARLKTTSTRADQPPPDAHSDITQSLSPHTRRTHTRRAAPPQPRTHTSTKQTTITSSQPRPPQQKQLPRARAPATPPQNPIYEELAEPQRLGLRSRKCLTLARRKDDTPTRTYQTAHPIKDRKDRNPRPKTAEAQETRRPADFPHKHRKTRTLRQRIRRKPLIRQRATATLTLQTTQPGAHTPAPEPKAPPRVGDQTQWQPGPHPHYTTSASHA